MMRIERDFSGKSVVDQMAGKGAVATDAESYQFPL
jgi:hypothetical protein